MEEVTKVKKDKFRWFVVILAFVLLFLLIQKNGSPKTAFDSCYEKCINLGFNENEDGTCREGYSKKNESENFCYISAGACLDKCR